MNLTVTTHASAADPATCRRLLVTALKRFTPEGSLPPVIQRRLKGKVKLYLAPLLASEFIAYQRKVSALHPERFDSEQPGSFAADSALLAALIESMLVRVGAAPRVEQDGDAERRLLQGRLLTGLESGLNHKQIVFLEGSTGLGKSRVMAEAALKLLAEVGTTQPVGMAAPTVAGLAHLAAEVRLTAQAKGLPMPPTSILLGRRQFVSVEKVRGLATDLLDAPPNTGDGEREVAARQSARDALAWIERGGLPVTTSSRLLAELCPDICLLSDDLLAEVPMWPELFEPGDYRLDAPPATVKEAPEGQEEGEAAGLLDPAEQLYLRLHAKAHGFSGASAGPSLVLLTHAKLCYAARQSVYKRPGGLPQWRALLIDEAHELERQMSSACSLELSLLWLRAELRRIVKAGIAPTLDRAQACITALTGLIDVLRNDDVRAKLDRGGLGATRIPSQDLLAVHPGMEGIVSQLQDTLRHLCRGHEDSDRKAPKRPGVRKRKPNKVTEIPVGLTREQFYRFNAWLEGVDDIAQSVGNVTVTYSPVRRFPSMIVGPRSLFGFLRALWDSTEAAGLLSATMFHLGKDGTASCGYLQTKLAVDRKRAAAVAPCHAAWVWSTPTLYVPTVKSGSLLTYPSKLEQSGEAEAPSKDDEAGDPEAGVPDELKAWWTQIGQWVGKITSTAVGGTLVLCCSYRDVDALGRRVQEADADRVIVQKRGVSLARVKEAFIAKTRSGKRPIWIATGGAWTGLDLRDELADDPAEDLLLTDLVITRLPFGSNRSAEHQARMRHFGFDAEAAETEMMLRQGMGRSVRRPGLKHRRIWMMDGRIVGPRAAYYQRVIGALLRYPQRSGF